MTAKLTRLTHKIAIQLHLVAELYHLQFSLQAASPETFGYTLVFCVVPTSLEWKCRRHGHTKRQNPTATFNGTTTQKTSALITEDYLVGHVSVGVVNVIIKLKILSFL
jgi:hypothetical protein